MSLQGLKVLIVEDELLILELFEFTLKLQHAEVRTARNVNEAMKIVKSWSPEVIITDIGLPEEDGYSFIKTLRSQPETKTLPILALSGYVSMHHEQLEDDEFLIKIGKPVDPEYLVKILAQKTGREHKS
ncbi:MAG: response regulator [Acidobacteriota bacterium]